MEIERIEQTHIEAVARLHGPRLLAVARRILGDGEDARDAVQDAYAAALRGLDGFRGDATLATWLHSIVVNTARMRSRANRARRESFFDDGVAAESPSPQDLAAPNLARPEVALERKRDRALVRHAIDRLPPRYRSVIVLCDLEDRTNAEAAGVLAISPTAAKVRLHRARRALAALLQKTASGAHVATGVAGVVGSARRNPPSPATAR